MSNVLQAVGVHGLTCALTATNFSLDLVGLKQLLDLRIYSGTTNPLSPLATRYYMRADRKDSLRVVNVFDNSGVQVYSIERLSSYNPVWSLLTYPQRQEVATISTGFLARSIDFHNHPGMTHRALTTECGLGGLYQNFFIDDGVKYSWSRTSKFLERVLNPGTGVEEVRSRIAKVRLMRQFKLDFEILIDEQTVEREVVFATAFVSILTQWGFGDITDTVGPTALGAPVNTTVESQVQQPLVVVVNPNDGLQIEEITD